MQKDKVNEVPWRQLSCFLYNSAKPFTTVSPRGAGLMAFSTYGLAVEASLRTNFGVTVADEHLLPCMVSHITPSNILTARHWALGAKSGVRRGFGVGFTWHELGGRLGQKSIAFATIPGE
jgi:hypothetical protein